MGFCNLFLNVYLLSLLAINKGALDIKKGNKHYGTDKAILTSVLIKQ